MATYEQIQALRRAIAEPQDADPYTDVTLNERIDAAGGVNAAAAEIWGEKAAEAAGLVDTTESGSSRKMSQLYANFLAMQKTYADRATTETGGDPERRRPRTRAIVRP